MFLCPAAIGHSSAHPAHHSLAESGHHPAACCLAHVATHVRCQAVREGLSLVDVSDEEKAVLRPLGYEVVAGDAGQGAEGEAVVELCVEREEYY